MADASEEESSHPVDGTDPASGSVLVEEAAVLNCYPFLLRSHFNQQLGGGLTFQGLVMRATNGVLNCHSGKISGKTVPRHVQPEQIWVHAVVQQNSETSPKDHDKQEKGFAKFRPNCIKRNGTKLNQIVVTTCLAIKMDQSECPQ
ncbi:uncharacterized protein LOC120664356 isoform X1 [Panicum virgatum]|uniref:uncharacterized protein LOC120664356 isoform X1 n=1 Tax=Panicum virgatum TaxID=38727 RepID=UPI0019D5E324|nr:uncharacterized protein LOC120664356 isoform X1 [Panicum virgatum]